MWSILIVFLVCGALLALVAFGIGYIIGDMLGAK